MEAKDESIYDAIHDAVLARTKAKPPAQNIKKMVNELLDKFETEGKI